MHGIRTCLVCVLLSFPAVRPSYGYAVLTHEAIIDSAWDKIRPLLLRRFPETTPEQLKTAHAYAYGGCIIQDMGYYPFGSKYFSDLVHYVRSGDFVLALLRDAEDVNDLAFALGALAHFAADTSGHPIAVNPSVALGYPKLRAQYGNRVTYADNPEAHLKTEFGFDVVEVAQGNYAPQDYHDFIGFQVSKPLLQRAFHDTYALALQDQFLSLDLALGTYRHTVGTILPEATRIAWSLKKDEIVKARPGLVKRRFIYNVSRSSYEKEWDKQYQRPGVFARLLAFLFRIVPKVGPFKSIAFKAPTQQTEKLFMESFNKTLELYRTLLSQFNNGQLRLPNMDFDTGQPTRAGEYSLADKAYSRLLGGLASHDFRGVAPDLQTNILSFYQNPGPPAASPNRRKQTMDDERAWRDTLVALEKLRALGSVPAPQGQTGTPPK